jgi:predicted anti-sigma-YlaC factor YlaD
MRCKTAQSFASLRLDGRLPSERAARLAEHLAGCEACRAASAAMAAAWSSLEVAPAAVAPDDWRRIALRLERPQSWLERLWLAQPGRLATAGALAIFILVGVTAGGWMSQGIEPSMPVEAAAIAEAFDEVAGARWLVSERTIP